MTQYPKKAAFQEGVQGPTAMGYIVPPTAIKDIRRLKISEHRLVGFDEKLPEGKKGMLAVGVVSAFLKAGRFPLWLDGEFVEDVDIQITGDDIHVNGHWKIEVKCDYRASECYGRPHPRCTGNLYLQIAERNPMKKF